MSNQMANPILVPAQAFVDDGWLMEVNREFFHPRGFALAICSAPGADGVHRPVEAHGFFYCQLQDWRAQDGIHFGGFDDADRAKAARTPPPLRAVETIAL